MDANNPGKSAFTLIELLVVVTIIVILLAMLTPAMDRAIYQAELAVCGTNLRAIAGGVTLYALENKRSYPHRPGALYAEYWKPNLINDPGLASGVVGGVSAVVDERPLLRLCLSINRNLNDPLSDAVDWDNSPSAVLETSYHLWFGFQYYGKQGMLRMGQRFEYTRDGVTRTFDVLAGDRDVVNSVDTGLYVNDSHPNEAGTTENEVVQDYAPAWETYKRRFTLSRWFRSGSGERGALDMNFARQDASVQRFDRLDVADERMTPVSEFTREHYPNGPAYIPKN